MTFLLQMISAMMEPLGVLGYLLAGLLLPRVWLALLVSGAWAMVMQVWEWAALRAAQAAPTLDLLFPRLSVALILGLLAFLAIDPWRRGRRAARKERA